MQTINQIIAWRGWEILGTSAIILVIAYAAIGVFAYYMGKREGC
jgi:hypothetical protein